MTEKTTVFDWQIWDYLGEASRRDLMQKWDTLSALQKEDVLDVLREIEDLLQIAIEEGEEASFSVMLKQARIDLLTKLETDLTTLNREIDQLIEEDFNANNEDPDAILEFIE